MGPPFVYAIYNMALDLCTLFRYLQHVLVRYLQHENGTFSYAIYNHASFLLEAPQTSASLV